MAQSLNSFRDAARETVLAFLWRAWSALGVAGQGARDFHAMPDPEALLVFTGSMARYDARLFDAVLEWLCVNGRFVSPQRVRLLMRRPGFRGQTPLRAAAAWLDETSPSWRWRLSARQEAEPGHSEALFLADNGRPLPVVGKRDALFLRHGLSRAPFAPRGVAMPFPADVPSCLWLRLRALFGVNARADILAYLLTNASGHAREIARRTGYAQRTIQDALSDMERSGYVNATVRGKTRTMRVIRPLRDTLLESGAPLWKPWPEILECLETLWWKVEDWRRLGLDGIGLDAEMLLTAQPMAELLARAGVTDAVDLRPLKGYDLLYGLFQLLHEEASPRHHTRRTG